MPRGRPRKNPDAAAATPAAKTPKATVNNGTSANIGFEEVLWQAADKLRNNLSAAEYKHVVLGLIFVKYISDRFEERRGELERGAADPKSDLFIAKESERARVQEDRDEYTAERVFWVPKGARWSDLRDAAKSPKIGAIIDTAMESIERENPRLKGKLTKDYNRPDLDKTRLGELVDLFSNVGLGSQEHREKDTLGRVYEYFLSKFASGEGARGGQFYTPASVVRLLVQMIEPYKGRVFDPCCGSGGMFVQAERFVEAHHGRVGDISIYGQESNPTTWRLAHMNLAIRGLEANLGQHPADSFHQDHHQDLKADFILANPPFNISDWGGEKLREDGRWRFGVPPVGNANFAWVQHFVHHLAPRGVAGFVLANGSMSSQQSGEGDIRRAIVEANVVDAMVALPGQLFYSTAIPACLWFLRRGREGSATSGKTLFIDARKQGTLLDRTHRELSVEEIARIAGVYRAWRSGKDYADEPGFCKSATTEEIASHGFVLTPGRFVGAAEVEEDDEPFDDKMQRLSKDVRAQFAEAARLRTIIEANLKGMGYGG
jgi:type I restriction enzyme M protein